MGLSLLNLIKQDQHLLYVFKEEISKYDLVIGNTFTNMSIVAAHPNVIKDLFIQTIKFHKHPFFSETFDLLSRGGIVYSQDIDWKRRRRIISSVFHFEFINQLIPVIERQIQAQFTQIDKKIQNKEKIELFPSISKILSSVIVKCFFGSQTSHYKINGKPYCDFYINLLNEIAYFGVSLEHIFFGMTFYKLGLTSQSRKLKKNLDLLKNVARQITIKGIKKIKSGKETEKNILTVFYEKNMLRLDENDTDPNKYTIEQLVGEFFAFFAAGTDTTSNLRVQT